MQPADSNNRSARFSLAVPVMLAGSTESSLRSSVLPARHRRDL